jgi:hypothetical protein
MSLVLQHRTRGLSQGIPAQLPEAAATTTGRSVVVARNVAHQFGRFQFRQSIKESDAEFTIERDIHRTVLVQEMATPDRLSELQG